MPRLVLHPLPLPLIEALLARRGFVRTGEARDEVDGLEWVHELELAPVR